MKKLKLMIVSAFAAVAVCFGFAFSPVTAFAEESAETPEIFVESVTDEEVIESGGTSEFEPKTYVLVEDGNKIELTLIDEKNAIAEMSIHGVPYSTVYMYYEYLTADSISLHATADDSYFGDFNLYADGTMEEIAHVYIPDDSEEESAETPEITFDDILAITGELMKQEGYGNEWEKAMYYIETAATAKKVDLSIFLVAGVLAFLVLDRTVKIIRWYRKKKSDTTSKDLKDIKTASGQQTTAVNALIDEEEKLVGEVHTTTAQVKDNTKREKALAEGLEKQNVAIRCLIRGVQIKQDLKDEAFRALNESDELCDKAIK